MAILHLNINSIYNKIIDFDQILDLELYHILLFNESKLDINVPKRYFNNPKYRVLRRDRGANGGGILVFVKKSLHIEFDFNGIDHEWIYFELKIIISNICLCFRL